MTARASDESNGLPGFGGPRNFGPILCAQDVVVDLKAHLVRVGDRVVTMPPKELQLLAVLVGSAGSVISRSQLGEEVWGPGPLPEKTLDVHIRRLRERIEPDPSHPGYIRTVRGSGYIFDTIQPSRRVDVAAQLLADPLRARIVTLLAAESKCMCHLLEETGANQATVSHHLRILREGGWVDPEPHGRFTYYRLRPEPLRALSAELGALADAATRPVDRPRPCR